MKRVRYVVVTIGLLSLQHTHLSVYLCTSLVSSEKELFEGSVPVEASHTPRRPLTSVLGGRKDDGIDTWYRVTRRWGSHSTKKTKKDHM